MNYKHGLFCVLLAVAFIGACMPSTPAPDEAGTAPAAGQVTGQASGMPLPRIFDCVRENGGLLLAAHRGGPAPGYPENALETLAHSLSLGIPVMEVDVATSRDGVLFLMHDRTLGRTTTGSGRRYGLVRHCPP